MKKTCAAFIFEGFIDHQVALVLACLGRSGDYALETFSAKGSTATAASGLRVMPHASLSLMSPEDFDVLMLPGGIQWEKGDNLDVFPLITAVAGRKPLIAVGEAVLALADLGLLDDIPHTGNDPAYIQQLCPDYKGHAFYRHEPLVAAGPIITVGGTALDPHGDGILGLFNTLQGKYAPTHEFFDQEQ
ncbi:MAG TPA: DJ-1/PfpI family protein [Puia sp.]|jgi:putative intracellular protease/amidase|nr:DJ-1/PfpI family protein [Puia sp.]